MTVSKPNFFIVGAPKCGTTAMNDYLSRHPAIFMAAKELHYFGKDLPTKNKISLTDYLSNFRAVTDEKVIGEASVWYLFSETAAAEIKQFAPGSSILIMLRNPVDVMHALHSQHLFDANEDVRDFEKALKIDADRKSGKFLPRSLEFTQLPSYFESVRYSKQVKRFFDNFGRENVQVIFYDEFVSDTEKVVSNTLNFLGVSGGMVSTYNLINANKKLRNVYLNKLIKNPPGLLKKLIRIILPLKPIRHQLMALIQRKNVQNKKRKVISEELRLALISELKEDIHQLEVMTGRDLGAWLR